MFIIYSNYEEAIICTPKTESQTIKEHFNDPRMGRDIRDYSRTTSDDIAVTCTSNLRVE